MNWVDHGTYIEIFPPKECSFSECLIFLERSDQEVLHLIKEDAVYKLVKIEDTLILCKVRGSVNSLIIEFPMGIPSIDERKKAGEYIWEWFDLVQDISGFYEMASRDEVLKPLLSKYDGLRIMCIPDLFEALVWAVLGQQITLSFAYTLKKRFVEHFGEGLTFEGDRFWVFPSVDKIASLNVEDLTKLQFSKRKAEYIIGIAKEIESGRLTKDVLLQQPDVQERRKVLLAIRGVGAWTADYVMMKCLHEPSAFPIADVGLHNALKNLLGLKQKPVIKEIERYAAGWEGWQAYAVFYLWRSLYDNKL
ncbi:DNA-3-methyladenine glycosylase family protein [Lysinibacillus odysseyi]|uniref:DNA-3-methyladenine glycosylase II n=1 Tax=Lysinibacillus odysseyi 34hs-1 = NBRC 100172 TaxID=1220589 RepID=A0A0A3IL69_9BACI|nr:DNA-3-methyladenine glycosylase [Lysinibacillus odysseyi]KGR85499.1 DNA-3-methyladenine glycosylase [Lysinibacillus odysseyi 34hs-1 = NBRC 100172]